MLYNAQGWNIVATIINKLLLLFVVCTLVHYLDCYYNIVLYIFRQSILLDCCLPTLESSSHSIVLLCVHMQ